MIHIINNISYSTCNLCLEKKSIKYRCYICRYCMCNTCFDRYLQHDNSNCPHCREQLNIVVINNNENRRRFKLSNLINKFKFNDPDYYCVKISLIIVIPILSYFVGYWITKKYLFIILNIFLGLIIILVTLILLIISYKCFCEW